jgi:hypothetical protein
MSRHAHNGWVTLSPALPESGSAQRVFRDHAARLSQILAADHESDSVDAAISGSLIEAGETGRDTALRAALRIVTDLARQRWSIRVVGDGRVEVRRPDVDQCDIRKEKARVRAQELVRRDAQLREPATRGFIKEMEARSVHGGHFSSIFSLIRDGRELAGSLRATRALPPRERARALREVIDPYIQFVSDSEYCDKTGLRVQEIWRYFRHTWTNQYASTPGRSMAFLVRDRASNAHPVIGIGALGSPIVQIRERDEWIGWHATRFIELLTESPSAEVGVWLNRTVEMALSEVFLDDLIEEQLICLADLRSPSADVVRRLTEYGSKQRELHHRLVRPQELKGSARCKEGGAASVDWRERATTHLFRSKRALSLADLLHARGTLQKYLSARPSVEEVQELVGSPEGRRVIARVLRKARADRVGIAMADITVCGAVAPYREILGGKLVSMLAASPEVVAAYRAKYVSQESEIASTIAGRPIVRPSELVFLGTTSLYGVGSSQYNRLHMPAERIGGKPGERLEYIELGRSGAYGTSHFSSETVEALVGLVQQSTNGQRVNSIFGEGVSPKLRKIREGLGALNLPSDSLLQHGRHRVVYGVPLVRNLKRFLIGIDSEPEYIFDMSAPSKGTEEIGRWWAERWLSKRIESDEVLGRVEGHTLVRPMRHGARVVLPSVDDGQGSLFEDLSY